MSLLSFSDEEMDLLTGLVLWTEDLTGWRAALGIGRIQSAPLERMAGCRGEYIDLMAGVPRIADDFAASR